MGGGVTDTINPIIGTTYRFDRYSVDIDRREVLEDGNPVSLQPKAFDLLVYLVEHRDRAVSKDELQEQIWPRAIVSETALTRCVMKARRAIGDDAETQRHIRTVHGHGYRFVTELESVQPAGATEPAPSDPKPAHKPARSWGKKPAVWAAGLAALGLAFVLWTVARTGTLDASQVRVAVLPVVDETGESELGWLSLGMMSLMNRMLEEQGVDVAADRSVMRIAADDDEDGRLSDLAWQRMTSALGVSHVLAARVDRSVGLLRMTYTLRDRSGSRLERTTVAKESALLARDAARTIAGLMTEGSLREREVRAVADDPFVNEAYARGLALQLEGHSGRAQPYFEAAIEADPSLFWPRYEYALTRRDVGDHDGAENDLLALRDEAVELPGLEEETAVNNALGNLYFRLARDDESEAALQSALRLADESAKPGLAAIVLINLGMLATRRGDVDQALAHYEQARDRYAADGGRAPSGALLNNMAGLYMRRGRLKDAEANLNAAIEAFRLDGMREFEASSLNRLGALRRQQGRYDAARELHEQSLAIRREMGNRAGVAGSLISLSEVNEQRGRLAQALADAESAVDAAAGVQRPWLRGEAWRQVGRVRQALGEYNAARSAYQSAAEAHQRDPDAALLLLIAETHWSEGNWETGLGLVAQALSLAREEGRDALVARALLLRARLEMGRGNLEAGGAALAEAREVQQANDDASLRRSIAAVAVRYHLHRENLAAAREDLDVLRRAPKTDRTWRLIAEAEYLEGDIEAAVSAMESARAAAGEGWDASSAERLQRYRAATADAR